MKKIISFLIVAVTLFCISSMSIDSTAYAKTTLVTSGNTYNSEDEYEVVIFGSYEQDNNINNGKEPIEWLVLDKESDKVLLISKYGLDCKIYNPERINISWADSEMREWLNDTFYYSAFNEEERHSINSTVLENNDNPEYGTDGGNNTEDSVFLLSTEEIEAYIPSSDARKCVSTLYAKERGLFTTPTSRHCYYWLRTPGYNPWDAMIVRDQGEIDYKGAGVYEKAISIRPAIWVDANILK